MNRLFQLQQAEKGDIAFSDDLLMWMLDTIGSLDSIEREAVYSGWVRALSGNQLTAKQKKWLLRESNQRHLLFTGIELNVSDNVFIRSFTALLWTNLLENHQLHPWMTPEEVRDMIQSSFRYLLLEQDSRGYVEGHGWAHAFAHGADLMGQCALSSVDIQDQAKVLRVLRRALLDIENFLYGEEGRLAKATVLWLQAKKLDEAELLDWVEQCSLKLSLSKVYNVCWKNYLMCLAYTLKAEMMMTMNSESAIDKALRRYYDDHHCF